jgi:hypothetical protein
MVQKITNKSTSPFRLFLFAQQSSVSIACTQTVQTVKLYLLREPFSRRSPDRTPPLLSGEMVAGCGMRSRPRGGGVWGGIRAGFGFLF